MLVRQPLLLQVDQLPQRHAQNGVRLHRRQACRCPPRHVPPGRWRTPAPPSARCIMAAGHATPIKPSFASACVRELRIMRMISSMFASANKRPSTVCLRRRALASRNCVRRRITVIRCRMNSSSNSLKFSSRGLPSTSARKMMREGILQRRELVELIQDDFRIGIALDFDHQPYRLFQIAFVANLRNPLDTTLLDQGRQSSRSRDRGTAGTESPMTTIRLRPLRALLDPRPRTDDDRAATGVVAASNAAATTDHSTRRKIGTLDDVHQLVDRHARLVNDPDQRIADLAQIVRRYRRSPCRPQCPAPR